MMKIFLLTICFSLAISITINQFSYSSCRKSQILNPQIFQRAFPLFSQNSSQSTYLPYFSNVDLISTSLPLSNVTILVHGLGCNAAGYFCQGMSFSQNQIIVAPWFGNQSVSLSDWLGYQSTLNFTNPIWDGSEWSQGGLDLQFNLSSFQMMDQLITFIQKKLADKTEKIVIAGFSAGAQFVQRYAWASDLGLDGSIRYFVSNPSSYLYFDNNRPLKECRPLDSSYVTNCSKYSIPDLVTLNSSDCLKYNRYKYGLVKIDLLNKYLIKAANRSLHDMVSSYTQKEILYVLGNWDVCNCNIAGFGNDPTICYPLANTSICLDTYPGSYDNVVDFNCQAMLQGSNRFQRGLNFLNYLKYLCGPQYLNNFAIVDGMEHDSGMYFQSQFFQSFGFGRKKIENRTTCSLI